jgi:uncharacterized Zn finger protein
MPDEIDHEFTDEAVCPHCGHKFSDSHEFFREYPHSSVKVDCDACGKEFVLERDWDVTYSTAKPKE